MRPESRDVDVDVDTENTFATFSSITEQEAHGERDPTELAESSPSSLSRWRDAN
jgi:hypothetical protein